MAEDEGPKGAKIVTLPGIKRQSETDAEIQEQVIRGLEKIIAMAKRGEVTGLAMAATVDGQGVMTYHTLAKNCHELISGTALLHHRVCEQHWKG
jgi:hypothetical protein